MKKTIFAGLTVLDPGEGLETDSGAFTGRDRGTIDRLLHVGAKTHRHNGTDGLANPGVALGASVVASAGAIPASLDIALGYTLEDASGGETMLSPIATVSTQPPVSAAQAAPSAAFSPAGGSLLVNTYFYAATFTDGEGGETPLGPAVSVERPPGFASGQVAISELNFGLEAAGAAGWRLYRAVGGGAYCLIATGGKASSEFLDDGTANVECDVHPPTGEENTTLGVSTLLVTLPSTGLASATAINVYASTTGDFGGGSFLAQYPVASAGVVTVFSKLELSLTSPPSVNLSIGGAHLIDPDTELLGWHWKRPVATVEELPAGEDGDVRMVTGLSPPTAYFFHNGEWEIWKGPTGVEGPQGASGTGPPGPQGEPGTPGSAAVGPWVKMTSLENSWVGTVAPMWPPAYRVYGDTVQFAGGVASGSVGKSVFILPSAARPAAVVKLGFGEGASNAGITMEVKTNGEIVPNQTQGAILYLTGLSFPLNTPP